MTQINDIRIVYFEDGCTISTIVNRFGIERKTTRNYFEKEGFKDSSSA